MRRIAYSIPVLLIASVLVFYFVHETSDPLLPDPDPEAVDPEPVDPEPVDPGEVLPEVEPLPVLA